MKSHLFYSSHIWTPVMNYFPTYLLTLTKKGKRQIKETCWLFLCVFMFFIFYNIWFCSVLIKPLIMTVDTTHVIFLEINYMKLNYPSGFLLKRKVFQDIIHHFLQILHMEMIHYILIIYIVFTLLHCQACIDRKYM